MLDLCLWYMSKSILILLMRIWRLWEFKMLVLDNSILNSQRLSSNYVLNKESIELGDICNLSNGFIEMYKFSMSGF